MQLFRTEKQLTPSWDLLRPSVALLQENIWPVIYLTFLPSLLTVVGLVLIGHHGNSKVIHIDGRVLTGLILAMLGGLWSLLTYPGLVYLQVAASRGEHPDAAEAFKKGLSKLLPMLAVSVLTGLAVVIGLALVIVPGLILLRGLYLANYYVIDKNLGPIEAMKQSFEDSKPHAGYIWGVIGVEALFGMAGSLFRHIPVIGYLIAICVSFPYIFAPAMRYIEITTRPKVKKPAKHDAEA